MRTVYAMSRLWIIQRKNIFLPDDDLHAKYIEGSARFKRGVPDFGIRSPNQMWPYETKVWMKLDLRDDFPQFDMMRTTHWFNIVSDQLLSVFENHSIPFELFDISWLRNDWPKKKYVGIHLLPQKMDILDEVESEFTKVPFGAMRIVPKSVPSETLIQCDKTHLIFVHDELKESVERAGLTGVEFLDPINTRIGIKSIPQSYRH